MLWLSHFIAVITERLLLQTHSRLQFPVTARLKQSDERSVMRWHYFIRHLRTKNGLKGEWEQLHKALWLLIFVLCSRFSRNLHTFHKTCNPQISTQWSKWARLFSVCLLWAHINPVSRRWPPSASERCSVTAAGMKHVPLFIHSHAHSSAVMHPWQRERNRVHDMLQCSLFSITWCWN